MKIILLGFEFESSNKGCEALSYSVMSLLDLMEELKPLEIVNINIHESMGELPALYPNVKFTNLRMKTKRPSFWGALRKEMRNSIAALDITHGDSFSDIYGKSWFANTTAVKTFIAYSKVPLILMPQTYGPFEAKWAKVWAKNVIKRASKVFTRDNLSLDYLKSIGIKKNIENTIDLAFMLPYKKESSKSDKIRIGLNVSGLLWDDCKKDNRFGLKVNYVKYCNEVLARLIQNDKYEIHLVPHVLNDPREGEEFFENDSKAIRELMIEFPTCVFPNNFKTALDAKNYICNLDFLVAPRMHASIAAFSSGVAVLPFAYSRKFDGVYGDMKYEHVIYAKNIGTEEAIEKTILSIANIQLLKSDEKYGMGVINAKHDIFCKSLLENVGYYEVAEPSAQNQRNIQL
ncbi:polysaccharide pyruvyl transferase family protein [Acetobacterium woodii]|uniref:Polysaccharide pyruvyl transferase n=1 Tax=Acetobacterium woodii (strain ATCC 29683 / DSM 1030 / JCM 2381 / KCTC 1655 / WB1) TaxID=931626 RepID=H6LEL9_ACEWD|nr:polysaccharide pyruvyl transferase family protein [Acetobacterium woodii]AFA48122.1 polysaccharide pyruvyl transferase [Acetobacterium woodii DSM 1030]